MGFLSLYYLVESNDIKKSVYNHGKKRLATYNENSLPVNDIVKDYEMQYDKGVEAYFDKYNIPEEYRKVIISTNLFRALDFFDFFGVPYVIGNEFFSKSFFQLNYEYSDDGKVLVGIPFPSLGLYETVDEPLLVFETKAKISSYFSALSFLIKLKMKGYYEDYIKALTDVLTLEEQEDYDSSFVLK